MISNMRPAEGSVGDLRVVFRGTNFQNFEFAATEEILLGGEERYEPVC